MLFVALTGISATFSQVKSSSKPSQNTAVTDDEKQKKQFIREQAILSLKDVLLNSKSAESVEQQAKMTADASVVLWDYDRDFAQNSITTLTTELLGEYESTFDDDKSSEEIEDRRRSLAFAVKMLIKAVAKKDPKTADAFQQRYFKIREKEIAGDSDDNLNESLKTAKESEDLDLEQSVKLVSKILDSGVPRTIPKYLFELKGKSPALADNLIRKALVNLSSNPKYSAESAIILSSYIFNENIFLLPLAEQNNDFSLITFPIDSTPKNTDTSLIKNYFAAYRNFLSVRLQNPANGNFSNLNGILQNYFLVKKMKKYENNFRSGAYDYFENAGQTLLSLAQTAQITDETLANLSGFAERLAGNSNPLGLDEGQNAFEKAEKSKDPKEKIAYLIEGIVRLIERRKFTEAERKIADIKIDEIQDSLRLLLKTRESLAHIEAKKWFEFDLQAKKISNPRIKAFLFLKAMSAMDYKKDKMFFTACKYESQKQLDALDDKTAKASGYVILTSLILPNDKTEGQIMFFDAVKAVNDSEYDEDELEIAVKIPSRSTYFAEFLGRNAFEKCFLSLAKNDWLYSQTQIVQLKSQKSQIFGSNHHGESDFTINFSSIRTALSEIFISVFSLSKTA